MNNKDRKQLMNIYKLLKSALKYNDFRRVDFAKDKLKSLLEIGT